MAQVKNSDNREKVNKILIGIVILLGAVLVGLLGFQILYGESTYSAVYLRTGDLYYGKLVRYPYFGLKNVYLLQATQDPANPLRIQKFSDIFWGPEDYIKLNRDEVVWHTRLRSDSQLTQLLKTNPALTSPQQQVPQQQVQQLPPVENATTTEEQ